MSDRMRYNPKVSIIGAGNVGTRYAYALIIRGLARHVVLVDSNRNRAEGEAMDLAHGAPFYNPVKIEAGGYPAIADSDLVVITAGRNQKPGETRLNLIQDNAQVLKDIIPLCVQHAPAARLIIVTNPVDVLSYVAFKLSGKPAAEVIGSGTVLDSARFRYLLGIHCGVDPRNVHGYILGEHGASEFPAWSSAMIGGVPIHAFCYTCNHHPDCQSKQVLDGIFNDTKNAANQIITRKGETSYGIGLALARITSAILNDENTILPVSTLMHEYYGVSEVYLSMPTLVNKDGAGRVVNLQLTPPEQDQFRASAAAVQTVIKTLHLN